MEFFDGNGGRRPLRAPKPPPNNGKAPQPVALGNIAAAAAAAAAAQRSQHFANAKDVSPELKTPKHMSMPQESLKHVPAYEPRLPSPPPPAEPPKMPWSDFDGKAAWATFRENAVTFDEQVFGCWSERPWRPMAGGASHLKTKKKAASIGRLSAAKSPFLTPGRVTTQPQTSDGAGQQQQQQQQQVLPPAVPQVQEWVTDADLKQAFKAPGSLYALKVKIRAEQTSSWLATKLSNATQLRIRRLSDRGLQPRHDSERPGNSLRTFAQFVECLRRTGVFVLFVPAVRGDELETSFHFNPSLSFSVLPLSTVVLLRRACPNFNPRLPCRPSCYLGSTQHLICAQQLTPSAIPDPLLGGASSWVLLLLRGRRHRQQKAVYKWGGERSSQAWVARRIPEGARSDLKPLDELAASLESAPEPTKELPARLCQ